MNFRCEAKKGGLSQGKEKIKKFGGIRPAFCGKIWERKGGDLGKSK